MKTLIHIMVLSGAVGLAVAGSAGCDSGNSKPTGTGGAGGKVGVGGSPGLGGSNAGGSPGLGGSPAGGAGGTTSEGGAAGGAGGSTGLGGAGGGLTPSQIHTMIINAPGAGDVPLSITTAPVAYPACN